MDANVDPFAGKRAQAKGFSAEDLAFVLEHFYADPVALLRELLGHWFPKKMPWVHRGLLALALERTDFLLAFGPEQWQEESAEWTEAELGKIERHFKDSRGKKLFFVERDADGKPVRVDILANDRMATVLPRGFSKTTLYKGILIICILYQMHKVMLYVSEAGPHAESQVKDIRMELEYNERITELYGTLAPSRSDPQKWANDEFETLTGIYLIARGRGGQVRGLNRASTRPSLILFDDLEDEESVSTDDQKRKVRQWFRGALERAGRLIGKTKIFGLGTILAYDALIPTLKKLGSWLVVEFGAVDPDGDPLWAEAMSLAKIEDLRISYAESGDLPVFYREVLSKNTPDEMKKFRLDKLRHLSRPLEDCIARAIAIDPAISAKSGASLCAYAVVGMTKDGTIHVYEAWGKAGMSPREQVDKYFELALQYRCTHHGVEGIAYQQALIHLLREEQFRKAQLFGTQAFFEITDIRHGAAEAKHKRIEGTLQPRYAAGYVTHEKPLGALEAALAEWPNCKMDIPDAVAMALTLLDAFAGLAGGDEESIELDMAAELEYEVGGEWRNAP